MWRLSAAPTKTGARQIDQQIGRLPGRAYTLGIAAVVHVARGDTPLSTSALGAFDAHPVEGALAALLAEPIETARGRLDRTDVAAAAAAARRRSVDELIDELIRRPAADALSHRTAPGVNGVDVTTSGQP